MAQRESSTLVMSYNVLPPFLFVFYSLFEKTPHAEKRDGLPAGGAGVAAIRLSGRMSVLLMPCADRLPLAVI